MYWNNIYKHLWKELDKIDLVPDPNNILDLKNLKPIAKLLKNWVEDVRWIKLDDEDISNLVNWLYNYKIIYSYPEKNRKLSKKWESIFKDIEKSKWEYDIMWLVEIAMWRLLQYEFEKKWYNVRLRKTTNFDDITSSIDYVAEFNDKEGNIKNIIAIDFTISEIWANSLYKNFKKETFPSDYKDYYTKKTWKKLRSIPRVVIKFDRDLAYSFTNNFFITVLEKWNLLNSDDLEENFDYAVQDLKWINIWSKSFEVSHVLEEMNSKVVKILNKF